MNMKSDFVSKSLVNDLGGSMLLVDARLKKLRRERRLVERAIIALTEVSRTRESRESRERRAARN
jgi:hypothetical protein